MASSASSSFTTNALNYQGVLIQLAPRRTPLLTMLMERGKERDSLTKVINMSAEWTPDAASQPSISESASLTAPNETTFVNTQETNVKQIFQEAVEISYDKEADSIISGTAVGGQSFINDGLDQQIEKHLRQMKLDMEYSILNGTYQADSGSATTARQMRGIITAAEAGANGTDASTAALSQALIETEVALMADNGAELADLHFFCGSFQMRKLNEIYKVEPRSRTEGGVTLATIFTSFGPVNIVYNPQVPNDTLLIADLAFLTLDWTPYGEARERILIEPLAKNGAGFREQIVGCMGIDYTNSVLHGSVYGLATS